MARIYAMCDFCKFDKTCDYESVVQKHSGYQYGFANHLYVCPNFIYDDGNPITNAEMLSTNIKNNVHSAAIELWNNFMVNFKSYEDFLKWLKSEVVIET